MVVWMRKSSLCFPVRRGICLKSQRTKANLLNKLGQKIDPRFHMITEQLIILMAPTYIWPFVKVFRVSRKKNPFFKVSVFI